MPRRLIALLLLLLPVLAVAQEAQPSWYEVEVIVFKQWEARGEDAEHWPTDAPDPRLQQLVQLGEPTEGLVPFSQLPQSELRMQGVYKVLAASQSYEPLLHIGWRQQGLSREQAPAVAIPRGWEPAPPRDPESFELYTGLGDAPQSERPALYGTIRVFEERYLHAAVDLRYRDPGAPIMAADEEPPLYVHRQQRRMRKPGELHYLDHPKLGVLIQVTPIEMAPGQDGQEEPVDAPEGEPVNPPESEE